jgi:hypothetical protein
MIEISKDMSDWMAAGLYCCGLALMWTSLVRLRIKKPHDDRTLNIKFSKAGWEALRGACEKRGILEETALERAVQLWAVLDEHVKPGEKITALDGNGAPIGVVHWW